MVPAPGQTHSLHGMPRPQALADRGIASLRYQFAYMEKRPRSDPDPPAVAHAVVRAAVAYAAEHLPDLPLIAGAASPSAGG